MDEETLTRLRQAVGRISRQMSRNSTDEGLTPTQATTLGAIARRGPVPLSRLAKAEGLDATQLSRVLGALERRGLVTRAPDPSDLRSVLVTATEAGSVLAIRIRENRAGVLADAVRHLDAEQQKLISDAVPALEVMVDVMLAEETR